jgi:hypothetical protein
MPHFLAALAVGVGVALVAPALSDAATVPTTAAAYVREEGGYAATLAKAGKTYSAAMRKARSNSQRLHALGTFDDALEAERYHLAPSLPYSVGLNYLQAEGNLAAAIEDLDSVDITMVETDYETNSNASADLISVDQDIAQYNAAIIEIWSLAKAKHPPVL